MQPSVIHLENVSKSYALWSSPRARFQDSLYRRVGKIPLLPGPARERILGAARAQRRDFFALRDINLDIRAGQSVGILGRNGAGKSTLLQIIVGTLRPSAGRSTTRGRIVALLELGSGFNAEFTGRANVLINASILGLSRRQIAERFEQIEAFADIGEFMDQPVKNYSSGMMLRLAFAVNVHLDPEILIIDEALSVGDAAFQRKCMGRIETLKKNGGTLLFVSHGPEAVVQLCDHAILLDRGELLLQGAPKLVTSQYYKLIFAPAGQQDKIRADIRLATAAPASDANPAAETPPEPVGPRAYFIPEMMSKSMVVYPSQGALIEHPRLLDLAGQPVNMLVRGERYVYTYEVTFSRVCFRVEFGMMIKSLNGIELGGHSTGREDQLRTLEPGRKVTMRFTFDCRLLPGVYFLNAGVAGVVGEEWSYLHRLVDAYLFRVQDEMDLPPVRVRGFRPPSRDHRRRVSHPAAAFAPPAMARRASKNAVMLLACLRWRVELPKTLSS